MIKPNMTWIPSPNYGLPRGTSGRNGNKIIAIVDHIMSGTLTGTDSWFQNSNAGASAHFGVGKNGEIHQYVDINNVAWANGGVNKPDWSLLIAEANPNYYTVSIEHEGQSGDVMTEAQYQATLALHRWLIGVLGIPVNHDTIIGHYRIDSVNKANCPGSGFPWARLFTDLKGESDLRLDNLVLYFGDGDRNVAADFADNLKCPLIRASLATPELLASATTKYQVGGATTSAGVTLLAGDNRFETMKRVLQAVGEI